MKLTTKIDLSDLVALILAASAIMTFITSMLWVFSDDTTDKWFSRFFLSMLCLGLFGIIRKLTK